MRGPLARPGNPRRHGPVLLGCLPVACGASRSCVGPGRDVPPDTMQASHAAIEDEEEDTALCRPP